MHGAGDDPDEVVADPGEASSTPPPEDLSGPLEAWLVRRIAAGDARAEDHFVHLYRPAVFATAAARLRNREDAKEVADDILMAGIAALRAGRIRDPERLTAFVRATTRHLISNLYRQHRRQPPCTALLEDLAGPDPTEELERAERDRIIRRTLEELEPLDRRILRLSLFEGLEATEIASELDLTPACVRQRKHRAISRITARLTGIIPMTKRSNLGARPSRAGSSEPDR